MIKRLCLLVGCLSLCLCGCSDKKANEIKKIFEENLVGYEYDEVVVEKITNGETTIYMVYVYDHHSRASGGTHYGISVYVWDINKGYGEWVYAI